MLNIKPEHIRRATLATRIFPTINSTIGINTNKLKSTDIFDGEIFCGGRSKNRDLLTFYGFLSEPAGSSTFLQLPLFRRSVRKLTKIVEQELDAVGAQEVLMPTLIPQSLWLKSKRIERQEDALRHVYKLKDSNGAELLLGPTFEESITKMVGNFDNINEHELPLLLYQTSPKFRVEPNPRFGVIRSNEFLMNDLYSFDANVANAVETYKRITSIYQKIFEKLGLNCIRIEGNTGDIGGKFSHEYQLPVSSGEDTVIQCNYCQHTFNSELQTNSKTPDTMIECVKCGSKNISKVKALELGHTFLLGDLYSAPLKAKFTASEGGPRQHFQMGCYGLGLTRILGAGIDLKSLTPSSQRESDLLQIRWPYGTEPYKFGIVLPAKRSKQYNAGSTEFAQELLSKILDGTRNVDILIEDRIKEGIGRRLLKLQNLGIPNIIVVGQRFLQDPPELELLQLDREANSYNQRWFTKEQLCDYISSLDTI